MLHPRAAVVLDKLLRQREGRGLEAHLNLTLSKAVGRLVDRHFDNFVVVCDDNRAKGRVLCVDLRVVDGPEAVELEDLEVPLRHRVHLPVGLVTNDVVDDEKVCCGA